MNTKQQSRAAGAWTAVVLAVAAAGAAGADAMTLVADGKSDYAIVPPAAAAPAVTTAARELQTYLAKVTGATLPIDPAAAAGTPRILVGPSASLRRLLPDLDLGSLGPDGIIIKTAGNTLVLVGDPPRGTLYAVYTFLEDHVGVRWWTAEATVVPRRPTLAIGALDVTHAPPFIQRSAFYREPCRHPVFAARLKLNGHHQKIPAPYGGHRRILGFVHTFNRLLPPEKYFGKHPEWYSLIKGKRVPNEQLCLSNDAMREELTRIVLDRLRQHPGAGMISVSQNDRHCGACECPACISLRKKYGGRYAGDLIRFVNRVAADVEKQFPDTLVETLAYHYTRTPPENIRPRDNVVVRLCSIECSFLQPLGSAEQNASFRKDIEGWSAIAPRLLVWNYVTNFHNYILPHPNMRVLAPNIRFFADNRVVALFEQGDSYTTIGDFVRLRAWLLAHLMWDPGRDAAALTRAFVEGYYGPAAPHLLAYLALVHDAAEKADIYLRCYMRDTASWLPPEEVGRATRLFDRALAAVRDDPVYRARVRRARLPLDNVWLQRYKSLEIAFKRIGGAFPGPADPAAAAREYIRLSEQCGNRYYAEGRPFADYARQLRARYDRPAGPPPEPCRDLPAGRWVDFQDGFFHLSRDEWARIVDDDAAADGRAARMPATHHQWALQCPLSDDLAYGNPWRCFVAARCETKKEAAGPVMTMGIYDRRARKAVTGRTVAAAEAAGATYRLFDLGTHDIHGGCYVWVAPRKRPDAVTAVYVDRIFLVRPAAKKQ